MSATQTNPTPVEWEQRTDRGCRKIVDRLDEHAKQLGVIEEKLESRVTHKALLAWGASLAVAIIAAAWVVVRMVSAEAREGADEARKDVRGVYNFLLTKQHQPRLEKPLAEASTEGGR